MLTVAASEDGNWVVSGSKDRCVHFWDAQTGDLQLSLQGHKNSGLFCFTSTQLTFSDVLSLSYFVRLEPYKRATCNGKWGSSRSNM